MCVLVIHPLNVFSSLVWYFESQAMAEKLKSLKHITSLLYALSFYALITMNIERYLAIKYPIYHRTSMTKNKLILAFLAMFFVAITLRILTATGLTPEQLPSSITFLIILTVMFLINCKMYIIVKQRRQRQNSENSVKTGDEDEKLPEKSEEKQNKSEELNGKSNKEKSNKLEEKSNKLEEKSNKLDEKSSKLDANNNKLDEKGSKLHHKNKNSRDKSDISLETQQNRQNKGRKLRLQNISTCILAVMCFTLCSLPGIIFNGLNIALGKEWLGENNFQLTLLWSRTLITMNSSFNTLLFFWKNATLRKEGKKFLRKLK